MKRLSQLTQELALALEVASLAQRWDINSPFQQKINELLIKAGRKPVLPDICTCEDLGNNMMRQVPTCAVHGDKNA